MGVEEGGVGARRWLGSGIIKTMPLRFTLERRLPLGLRQVPLTGRDLLTRPANQALQSSPFLELLGALFPSVRLFQTQFLKCWGLGR